MISGETLGCTSPQLHSDLSAFIFIADGRFHMESVMIRNPTIPSYRYDPYNKVMSLEKYDIQLMKQIRLDCVTRARQCKVFGVILGTLGHQGNTGILKRLKDMLQKQNKVVVTFLMAELNPVKLKLIKGIDVSSFVTTSINKYPYCYFPVAGMGSNCLSTLVHRLGIRI